MAEFIAQNMAPIMFASLVVFLLLGYPVAFSLGAVGLAYFVVAVELAPLSAGTINLTWGFLNSLPDRVFGVMNNDTLLAIPFFTFMGLMLERSGMAEDLLDTIGQLFGTIRGGLAYAVIFVGALLAATTGVVAASVISMGLISLPIMLRYGYDRRVASGVIAASGTLAQIIPPSLVLIVMADQLGKSVGDMYEGAFIPGIVLAGLYAAYIWIVTTLFPSSGPGLPPDALRFKETSPAVQATLARFSGGPLLIVALIGAALQGWFVLVNVAAWIKSGDVLTYIWALVNIGVLLGLLYFVVRVPAAIWSGRDERGLLSLLLLTIISAGIGIYVMWDSHYAGADFVILTMAVAIIVAFALACVNWVIAKITGLRFLSLMAQEVTFVMVPPLFLIFLVLGTIFVGIATPTEGGAMGAVGSMLLAGIKRLLDKDPKRFNFGIVKSAAESTAKLSSFVLFILIGARIFSLTFYGVNGHVWVEHLLTSLPGGQIGFLIFVNAFVFLLAFFLDFFELAFIVVPLLGPAAAKLGIDLIWFGVMLGVNMQTSFMHPPFGFALFYLRSVAPNKAYTDRITGQLTEPVTTGQIYVGAIPFVIIQCIMVGAVIGFPAMVMHYKNPKPTPASTTPAKPATPAAPGGGSVSLPGAFGGPPKGLGGVTPGLGGAGQSSGGAPAKSLPGLPPALGGPSTSGGAAPTTGAPAKTMPGLPPGLEPKPN